MQTNKRYWLRGGMIGGTITGIFAIIVSSYGLFSGCTGACPSFSWNSVANEVISYLFTPVNLLLLFIFLILIIVGFVVGFLVGIIFGWLYGKIKNH